MFMGRASQRLFHLLHVNSLRLGVHCARTCVLVLEVLEYRGAHAIQRRIIGILGVAAHALERPVAVQLDIRLEVAGGMGSHWAPSELLEVLQHFGVLVAHSALAEGVKLQVALAPVVLEVLRDFGSPCGGLGSFIVEWIRLQLYGRCR